MSEDYKDVVAVPAPSVPVSDELQALVASACEDVGNRQNKLLEEAMALLPADLPGRTDLVLCSISQLAAALLVGAIGQAMKHKGYTYPMSWQVMILDVQQRAQSIINQVAAGVSPGSETMN